VSDPRRGDVWRGRRGLERLDAFGSTPSEPARAGRWTFRSLRIPGGTPTRHRARRTGLDGMAGADDAGRRDAGRRARSGRRRPDGLLPRPRQRSCAGRRPRRGVGSARLAKPTGGVHRPARDLPGRPCSHLRATIEGLVPATGRTLSSFAAGREAQLLGGLRQPPQLAPHVVALSAHGPLDLETGRVRAIGPRSRAWCRAIVLYRRGGSLHVGQFSLFPCTATGERLPPPRMAPAVAEPIGARADDVVAWSDDAAVVARPARG
jgi:hypothetical protein